MSRFHVACRIESIRIARAVSSLDQLTTECEEDSSIIGIRSAVCAYHAVVARVVRVVRVQHIVARVVRVTYCSQGSQGSQGNIL